MNIEKLFSVENISVLADVMEEKNLEEITMEYDDAKLTLKAKRPCPPPPMGGMMPAPMAMPAPAQAAAPAAAPQVML